MRKTALMLFGLWIVLLGCYIASGSGAADPARQGAASPEEYPWSVMPVPKDNIPSTAVVVLDDFEKGTARWTQRGDGSMGIKVRKIDDAPQGKHAAEITFYGTRKEKSWVNILWYMDGGGWPPEGKYLSFWAKAPEPCKIMVNLHEGPPKFQNEFFGATVELTKEWKQYKLPVGDFATYIWGHKDGNKKLDIDRTILFGINQRFDQQHLTFPATFMIDAIYIEKE